MLLHAEHMALKVLPVKLRQPGEWPVALVTLKDRTLNPVARLFIDHVRAAVGMLAPSNTVRSPKAH